MSDRDSVIVDSAFLPPLQRRFTVEHRLSQSGERLIRRIFPQAAIRGFQQALRFGIQRPWRLAIPLLSRGRETRTRRARNLAGSETGLALGWKPSSQGLAPFA